MNNKETLIDTTALKMVIDFLGQKDSEAQEQAQLIATLKDGPRKQAEENKLRDLLKAQQQLLDTVRSALAQ